MEQRLGCEEIAERALIERYVAGQLSADESAALEAHYLTCDRCQTEVRLAMAIRETLPAVREAGARPPLELVAAASSQIEEGVTVADVLPLRRRLKRRLTTRTAAALGAAALLAGLLLIRPSRVDDEAGRIHREEGVAEETVPALVAPAGAVAAVDRFSWSRVADVDLYRLTAYDGTGEVVWEVETRDTLLTPPDAATFEPNTRYVWKVAARVGWDRWVSSELVEFTITKP